MRSGGLVLSRELLSFPRLHGRDLWRQRTLRFGHVVVPADFQGFRRKMKKMLRSGVELIGVNQITSNSDARCHLVPSAQPPGELRFPHDLAQVQVRWQVRRSHEVVRSAHAGTRCVSSVSHRDALCTLLLHRVRQAELTQLTSANIMASHSNEHSGVQGVEAARDLISR